MSPLFDKLSPELRLQIYEYVVQSDYPLKRSDRIHKQEAHPSESQAYSDTAILSTCKTAYYEATPIFFKLNTISLRHDDVCLSLRNISAIKLSHRKLIHHLLVIDDAAAEAASWTDCKDCSEYLRAFLNFFTTVTFPKLRSVTVHLFSSEYAGTCLRSRQLQDAGLAPTFTDVGRFEVTVPSTSASTPTSSIQFVYPWITLPWTHFHSLPKDHPELHMPPKRETSPCNKLTSESALAMMQNVVRVQRRMVDTATMTVKEMMEALTESIGSDAWKHVTLLFVYLQSFTEVAGR